MRYASKGVDEDHKWCCWLVSRRIRTNITGQTQQDEMRTILQAIKNELDTTIAKGIDYNAEVSESKKRMRTEECTMANWVDDQ